MAARAVGIRQEGVNPCRMVPSMWDEVHVQLHVVTGEVQQARLIVAVQRFAMCELPRWTRIVNFKNELIWWKRRKSKRRFRVNMISLGRGEKPPVSWGTG